MSLTASATFCFFFAQLALPSFDRLGHGLGGADVLLNQMNQRDRHEHANRVAELEFHVFFDLLLLLQQLHAAVADRCRA